MKCLSILIALAGLAPMAHAQDKAGFIVRLGVDTLSVEEYTRTPTQLRGVSVTRAPRPSHRTYTIDLNADGTARRYEIIARRLDPGPGPAETISTIEFDADSARSTVPRGDSLATVTVAAGAGAAPFQFGIMGLIEQLTVQARAAGQYPYSVPFISPGGTQPSQATLTEGRGDTLLLMVETPAGLVGPWILRSDAAGRLLGYSGPGTPFQAVTERLPSADVEGARASYGARSLGTLSPRDTVNASVGDAAISVEYSRPKKRGRDIFGAVVPWGKVWRTGANQATHFRSSTDLVIGGAPVPAGTYTLWTLPSPDGWKLIINKQTGQWGTIYSPEQDLARVDFKVETLPQPVEEFTIEIEPDGPGVALRMAWDRTRFSVPVTRKP